VWKRGSDEEGWRSSLNETTELQAHTTAAMLFRMGAVCVNPTFTLILQTSEVQMWHVAHQSVLREPTQVYESYVLMGRLDRPGQMVQLSPTCQLTRKPILASSPVTPRQLLAHLNATHWVQYMGLLDNHSQYVLACYWPFPWDQLDDGVVLQDLSPEGISRTGHARWDEFAAYLQLQGGLTLVDHLFVDIHTRRVRYRINSQPTLKTFDVWYGPRNKLPTEPVALLW
jgi:hypothetical protein